MSNLITVVSSGDSRADHASTETAHNSRLTMAYFNAQSVRQIAGEIHDFIVDNKLDALILTETWLQEVGDEPCVKEMTPRITFSTPSPVLDVGVVVSLSL